MQLTQELKALGATSARLAKLMTGSRRTKLQVQTAEASCSDSSQLGIPKTRQQTLMELSQQLAELSKSAAAEADACSKPEQVSTAFLSCLHQLSISVATAETKP